MSHAKASQTAIVGAGSIGVAFAVVFARAGCTVRLYDPDATRRSSSLAEVRSRLIQLASFELLLETPDVILERITVVESLASAVEGADLVQECAPELVELKSDLFRQMSEAAPATALLASSSSALTTSSFADDLETRSRCLIAHPGNPPYLIPAIEIVPAPFTDAAATDRAMAFYREVGLEPVLVSKEVEGFVFNRLQGALLREAYCLVRDGVATVADIDTVVRQGLGMRWSVIGPFETVDLNTRGGIASHALKMGPAYARMGAERGQHDAWTPDLVAQVAAQRRELVPLDQWEARVAWRDTQLMLLARNRKLEDASKRTMS